MTEGVAKQGEETAAETPVPAYLIYEEIDGKPIYYLNYEQVLRKEKTLEAIMGCSDLQGIIISTVLKYLYRNLPEHYTILTNEIGLHIDKGTNLSGDITIFEKQKLKSTPIQNKYFEIAPTVVIEIDTKADVSSFQTPLNYYYLKTQKLLDFGVEKVIWIISESKKVMVATQNDPWLTMNWDREIEVVEGYRFSIARLIEAEGLSNSINL